MQISCRESLSQESPNGSPSSNTGSLRADQPATLPTTTIGNHLFGGNCAAIFGGRPSTFHPQGIQAGWNHYIAFTRSFGLPSSPLTAEKVTLFVAYLGSQGLSISTIQSYMVV